MIQSYIIGIALIIGAGIAAQWLAWRLHLPSILLLLVFGFVLGPATGLLNPDALFGDLLFPIVSLAVGVILFEGGLGLKFRDVRQVGSTVLNLITVGALATWVVTAAAAYLILDLSPKMAVLLAAVLIVSGPTVILPLLRDIRPKGQVGTVLRWEGILIDPVGATFAVLVFEALLAASLQEATGQTLLLLVRIMLIGAVLGWLAAKLLAFLLRRYLIPDHLQNAFTLMLVLAAFALSNTLAPESGLLTATVMGVVMANQKGLALKHIVEFKEDLGVVITSGLFILLVSRLSMSDLTNFGWPSLAFLAALILIARPLAVWLSTRNSELSRGEKLFLSWMAPRGVVAAAVASIFAIELAHLGFAEAERLMPLTFLVISGTVALYGLSAEPLARRLGLAEHNPQGALMVGAHDWARKIAHLLKESGFRVVLVDTNPQHAYAARREGLEAFLGNILDEDLIESIDLAGVGRLLALTSNNEVNALACMHFGDIFGKANVYQLSTGVWTEEEQNGPAWAVGRRLFGDKADFEWLDRRFAEGWSVMKTPLPERFAYQRFVEQCGDTALPLFLIGPNQRLRVLTADQQVASQPNQELIWLLAPQCELKLRDYIDEDAAPPAEDA